MVPGLQRYAKVSKLYCPPNEPLAPLAKLFEPWVHRPPPVAASVVQGFPRFGPQATSAPSTAVGVAGMATRKLTTRMGLDEEVVRRLSNAGVTNCKELFEQPEPQLMIILDRRWAADCGALLLVQVCHGRTRFAPHQLEAELTPRISTPAAARSRCASCSRRWHRAVSPRFAPRAPS